MHARRRCWRARLHLCRARIDHPELSGLDDAVPQLPLEPECNQDARGVRGELDAGTGLFQPLRLIEQSDAKPALRHGQRRSQPADARTRDDDVA